MNILPERWSFEELIDAVDNVLKSHHVEPFDLSTEMYIYLLVRCRKAVRSFELYGQVMKPQLFHELRMSLFKVLRSEYYKGMYRMDFETLAEKFIFPNIRLNDKSLSEWLMEYKVGGDRCLEY